MASRNLRPISPRRWVSRKQQALKSSLATLLIACLPSVPVAADELRLDAVLNSVRSSFPLIEAARTEVERAEGSLTSARGAYDFSLSAEGSAMPKGYYDSARTSASFDQLTQLGGVRLFGGYGLSDGTWPVYDGKLVTNNGGEFRLGAELPLLRDRAIDSPRAALRINERGVAVAQRGLDQRMLESALQGTQAYFGWVAAGTQRSIFESLLKVAKDRTIQFQTRVKAGDLAPFDLLDNQRAELQREAQLVRAEEVLQTAALRLSLFVRDQSGTPVTPERKQLPRSLRAVAVQVPPPPDQTFERAYAIRPDLLRLEEQLKQNVVEQQLAENQLLPSLDLHVTGIDNVGQGPIENSEVDVQTGLKFNLPLQRRDAKGKLQQAQAKARELQQLATFTRDRIKVELNDTWQSIQRNKQRFEFASAEARAARELEEGERIKFSHGDSNLIFLNLREQTSAEAALREVEALLEYYRAIFAYRAATGLLLDDLAAGDGRRL